MKPTLKSLLIPLALLVVVVMAYGLLIPSLGFYGDDWSYIYYHKLLGFEGPGRFAAYDRPFSAPFYNLTITLLGLTPLPYHIFLLILRWLSAVLLWQVLIRLWPQHEKPVFWTAVLFALYPGFSQQPISVEYILHFAGLDLFLLSLLMMQLSLQSSRRWWVYAAAGTIFAANIFAIEYFVGLELLRPLILWLGLGSRGLKTGERVRTALAYWLPYLLVVTGFFVWRVFLFQFPTYNPGLLEKLSESPLGAAVYLVKRILMDSKTVLYDAWRQAVRFPAGTANRLLFAFSALVSLLVLFFTQRNLRSAQGTAGGEQYRFEKDWAWQPVLLGGVAIVAAGWPFWITGIDIEMGFPWDRPTLPFMLGVSLLVVGLIELIVRSYFRVILFSFLVLLALGFHTTNAEVYQAEWQRTRDFFWQLTWRAPGLETGTVLAADDIPLYRVADSALTAPLNWTYAPELDSPDLAYKLFDLHVRIGTEYARIPGFEENLPIRHDYRFSRFQSTTSSLLVFHYPENGCLRIISPEDRALPFLPEKAVQLAPLSGLDQIRASDEPVQPPAFMGPEPAHEWCYILQKAELAAQNGDWAAVVSLAKTAAGSGLQPQDPSEWWAFIEGYAMENELDIALQLTRDAAAVERLRPFLCRKWSDLAARIQLDPASLVLVAGSLQEPDCIFE